MTSSQASRYLDLLGVDSHPPSLFALTELVTAHVSRIPFENVSKLIQHARGELPVLVPLDRFLDGIDHDHLGGTCYACACQLNALLSHLGYEVRLCGAAMSLPDVHVVNVVKVDSRDYLVDVGYGAPFFSPLLLDGSGPVAVDLGRERYVLYPRDEDDRAQLSHLRDGQVIHGYIVTPTPRDVDHFASVIVHSFRPESEFLNHLRIVLHRPERSISLSDFRLTIVEGGRASSRTLHDRTDLRQTIEGLFKIPGEISEEAMTALTKRGWTPAGARL
jgi:arylamine N-acetyltransferase